MKSKKFITTFVTSLAILGCLIFSACQGEAKNEDIYYTVSYESAHGTAPAAKEFLAGTVLQAADLPALVADGYIFEGWYISTVKITPELAQKVTTDITLEAKWSVVNSGTNQGNDDNQGEDNNGGTQGDDNNQGTENQGTENQGTENQGTENQGGENQGEQNQGEQNQGEQNQGEQNQGEGNQGEQNQGGENQGEENQGEQNQGEQNQGEQNQGEQNQGEQNQGEQNQGEQNQGEGNQGEQNQGEQNQGEGNQGGETPQEVYYTVTYKSQDGVVRDTKEFLAGSQLTAEDLPEPEIPGYSFNGWYFGDELVTPGFKVEDDIILVVVYLPCCTISYSTARGSAPASKNVVVGTKLGAEELQPLVVNNYEFDGWYLGNTKITVLSEFSVQNNINLVAKWNYTITYSTAHGTTPESKKVLGGTALTDAYLPTLTANDYDFAGWFIGNRAATVGTEVSDNIILTARWTRSGFSIDVTADTILTDDEKELAVTAERSGDNFILTATPGYDFYIWSVDKIERGGDYYYSEYYYYGENVSSVMYSIRNYSNVTIPENLKNNTLTFNESNLPRSVAADGTYVVYVQAFRFNGNRYETAGLVFAAIKM